MIIFLVHIILCVLEEQVHLPLEVVMKLIKYNCTV